MGNRAGRRKTLKVKQQGAVGLSFHCKAGRDRIDSSVCETRQIRKPHDCMGCRKFRGE